MAQQLEYSAELNAISRALSMVQSVAELSKSPPFNLDRFEFCKRQIQNLTLPDSEMKRNQNILKRASRFVEFGEFGAVRFELKLLARNLKSLLSPYDQRSI